MTGGQFSEYSTNNKENIIRPGKSEFSARYSHKVKYDTYTEEPINRRLNKL